MKPAPFRYEAPDSVEAASALLEEYGDDGKLLAGGQSLGPLLNLRMATPEVLIDLRNAAGLHEPPRRDGDGIELTAMTTYQELLDHDLVTRRLPLLTEAIPYVGHQAIRNAGTIGGCVGHADPAAEVPAVLLALDASVTAESRRSNRTIPVDQLFTGVFSTSLAPDEVVTRIRVPALGDSEGWAWSEVAPRHGDYAIVGAAAVVRTTASTVSDVRVALSGVADTPYLCRRVYELIGSTPTDDDLADVARDCAGEIAPRADLVASPTYKAHLIELLVERVLRTSLQRSGLAASREET